MTQFSDADRKLSAELFKHLDGAEVGPSTLSERLKVSRKRVHRMLGFLQDEGLIVKVRSGPRAAYTKAQPHQVQELAQRRAQAIQVTMDLPLAAAQLLASALDTVSRLGMGQWRALAELARWGELPNSRGEHLSSEDLTALEADLDTLSSAALGLSRGASFGVFSPNAHSLTKPAWALHCALRHRLAWDRAPEGGMTVSFDEPMHSDLLADARVQSYARTTQERRITVQMGASTLNLLQAALTLMAAIARGDFSGLVAPAQIAPHAKEASTAKDVTPQLAKVRAWFGPGDLPRTRYRQTLEELQLVADRAQALLQRGSAPAGLRAEGPWTGTFPSVAPDQSIPQDWSLELEDKGKVVGLEDLPPGMAVAPFARGFRVIELRANVPELVMVSESHSLQTAILMARNRAAGRTARSFSF